jgi:hypothetical protein
VQDSGGASTNVATISVTVTAANTPPVATNDSATTPSGSPVVIYVLANDSDPDGDTLDRTKLAIASAPAHGGVTINKTTGGITYTPAAGYSGPDAFVYTVKDVRGATSNPATVTINVTPVNLAPVAANDSATAIVRLVRSGGWLRRLSLRPLPVTVNVLANDSDAGGALDPTTVTLVTPPASGTATVNSSTGAITYFPGLNSFGTVSFAYTVKDNAGAVSVPATVTITVRVVKPRSSFW